MADKKPVRTVMLRLTVDDYRKLQHVVEAECLTMTESLRRMIRARARQLSDDKVRERAAG